MATKQLDNQHDKASGQKPIYPLRRKQFSCKNFHLQWLHSLINAKENNIFLFGTCRGNFKRLRENISKSIR